MKTITAVFDTLSQARHALHELERTSYFNREDVSLVSLDVDNRYSKHLNEEHHDEPSPEATGAGAGATAGAVIGALTGLLLGTSILVMPGVGAILALGPIGATLAGAGVGAAIGGLTGALVGLGVDDHDAEIYQEAVRRGGTLLLVRAPTDHVEDAVTILNNHNPVNLDKRAEEWRNDGWGSDDYVQEPYSAEAIKKERARYTDVAHSEGIVRTYGADSRRRSHPVLHP